MQKLTISKEADEIKAASAALASFINGRIEDVDTPTKYVFYPSIFLPGPLLWFFLSFFFFAPLLIPSPKSVCRTSIHCPEEEIQLNSCGAAGPIGSFALRIRDQRANFNFSSLTALGDKRFKLEHSADR